MEKSYNNTPTFYSITGEIGGSVELVFCTQGLSTISIIFQVVNRMSFNNEVAEHYVSNTKYGYYTLIRNLDLGAKDVISYGFTTENQLQFGNVLFFRWCKVKVQAIENLQVKIVVSGR